MKVAEQFAGKRAKCPTCGKVLLVPPESEAGDGSDVALAGRREAANAPADSARQYEELGLESPAAVAKQGKSSRCPGCGKQLSAGARICVTCGLDLQSGQSHSTRTAAKEREVAASDERGPWFAIAGIEFTTGKIIVLALVLVAIFGGYFGILKPAKDSRSEYDGLTKKFEGPLLQIVNAKLAELGPDGSLVVDLYFDEPMFMLSVPPELVFSSVVADERTTLPIDTLNGWYDHKTGSLRLKMPNRIGDVKIEVTANLPPGGVPAPPVAVTAPNKPSNPPREKPETEEGSTFWELGGFDDWMVEVSVKPWPARASAPSTIHLSATLSDFEKVYKGKAWWRVVREEAATGEWVEMKQTKEGTLEADAEFEAQATLPAGKVFVQFRLQRDGEEKPTDLVDWSITVSE